ncbi:MAG: ABC transporter substrate-binding protein [Chloroflexi bacterium]|nr:ABC transporter substrate-binding protein [Chloroflexota bacterium]
MDSRKFLSVSLLTIAGLLLGSCAPAAAPTPTPKAAAPPAAVPTKAPATTAPAPTPTPAAPTASPKAAAETPRYGGVLTTVTDSDAPSLDPQQEIVGAVMNIIAPCYNGIVQADPRDTTKIIPDLAERWEISTSGTVYTFQLQKGVRFHDGAPFTSQDAKSTLERIKNPPRGTKSPRQDYFQAISRIETPDENTLRIVTSYPSASFLSMLSTPWIMVVPKHVVDSEGDMKRVVVGTGPFRFKTLTRGVSARVEKNPDYFIKGRPYLDGVLVYVMPDAFARVAALRAGNIMLIRGTPGIPEAQAKVIEATMPDKIVLDRGPHALNQGLALQTKRAPFTDVRVRQAVAYALDREKAIRLNDGLGVLGGVLPPFWGWGLPKEELDKMPGYGPDKDANLAMAKKLLADAGFPNGFKTVISARQHAGHMPAAVFANAELAKVGIQATIQPFETAAWADLSDRRDFDALTLNMAAELPDPDQLFSRYWLPTSGSNWSNYENPKFMELFEKQARMLDTGERRVMVQEMQRIAMTDSANLVFLWFVRIVPYWVQVKGFAKAPHHFYAARMEHVWLAK